MSTHPDIKFFNANCLHFLFNDEQIQTKSVSLFIVDLPYGQTDCHWDTPIDLKEMWRGIKRTMKDNALILFFCTTMFGQTIIESNKSWFRYDLVWEKTKKLGFLNANKMPLRGHEMIYVFSNQSTEDVNIERNLELRQYAENIKKFINKSLKELETALGHYGITHFYGYKNKQFGLVSQATYQWLIDNYKIDTMPGFLPYETMKGKWQGGGGGASFTYNPQKTPGKPYKTTRKCENLQHYTLKADYTNVNATGDRHPSSVLKYSQPSDNIHPTQKPLDLIEFLIKSYSNPGDIVCDFVSGSGVCAVGCLNTGRKFTGCEMDAAIYQSALNRINTEIQNKNTTISGAVSN